MKKNEPFYFTTQNYLFTYHGGGYSPEHLTGNRRGTIKTFTNSSIKRLCLKIESIKNFKPEWRIIIIYKDLPDWNIVKITINKFTTRLSISRYSKEKPVWIWKKNIVNNNLEIIIITNIKPSFNQKTFKLAINYYWQHYSPINIESIQSEKLRTQKNIISDFCFNNTMDANYPFGRWWGIINQNYYKKTPIVKKSCSLTDIEILELKNKDKSIHTNEIKKNLYKK